MIRLSEYVIDCIAKMGVKTVFMVSGGGGMYLIDSLGRRNDMNYICNHHEQASVIAAEGYQRETNNLGAALVTTGPAGTNTITGILCAWNDSIPLLVISGQANSKSLIGDTKLRQRGVHEANITEIVKTVTKYAVTVKDEKMIRYHMKKALYLALHGRPGPVWIDIPLDIQAKMINPLELKPFLPDDETVENIENLQELRKIEEVKNQLASAERPIIIVGHGVRLSHCENAFLEFVEKYRIPVVTSKNAFDIVNDDHELLAGRIGINGQRAGNFAVQNSDFVISLGCRLAFPTVGYAVENFAREAKKTAVDIDKNQLEHANVKIDFPINLDVGVFIREMDKQMENQFLVNHWQCWINQCNKWRQKYPAVLQAWREEQLYVNPYYFYEVLSEEMKAEDTLVTDQGAAFYCFTVAFKTQKGQKAFTNGGFSPMGYGLPAAIGAACGKEKGQVVCVHGDGGLQMNIQELQTMVHNRLPVKLFVFDNKGYLSIKQTQTNYFDGFFVGCDPSSGVSCPDTMKIGEAYGIKSIQITDHKKLREKIRAALDFDGPVIIDVKLNPMQVFEPKVISVKSDNGVMTSKPLEDMSPLLDREEFYSEMIIRPLDE